MFHGKRTDSPERNLRAGRLALLPVAAALAVAALLVGLATGPSGALAQEAGATYTGSVDVVTEGTCGGGTIALTVSDDGASISQIVLDGTYVGGVFVNSLSTPEGPFTIALDPGIAIADDGTFSETIQPVAGIDADLAGEFTDSQVSGTFGVTALECVDVGFSGEVAAEAPAAAATATVVLPSTGGAPTGSGGSAAPWAALAAMGGVALLGGGALALRRRA